MKLPNCLFLPLLSAAFFNSSLPSSSTKTSTNRQPHIFNSFFENSIGDIPIDVAEANCCRNCGRTDKK